MSAVGTARPASSSATDRWHSRPATAVAVRAIAFLTPLAAGVLAGRAVAHVLAHPGGMLGTLAFIAQIAVVSTAAATCTDRFTRRLLPLAALYRMSLVFPDEAPSRFRSALRAGSSKRLEADLSRLRAAQPGELPHAEAAHLLLGLLNQLGRHERLTRGHTERVRAYSEMIAEEMGLTKEDRELLRWGALAHDVGKLAVPADILNKDARPTAEEWAVLQNHPTVGGQLVEPLADWLGDWRLAACEHHERWDGSGYPVGLSGAQISLAGRIIAVADAYDVMTSTRSYKRPTSPEKARRELVRCAGTQFDPEVVRAMLNISLGKLRLATGPLGALGNLPLLGRAPLATQAASTASVTVVSGLVASVLALGNPVAPAASTPGDPVAASAMAAMPDERFASPQPGTTGDAPSPVVTIITADGSRVVVDAGDARVPGSAASASVPAPEPAHPSVPTGLPGASPTTTITETPASAPPSTAPPADEPPTTIAPPGTSPAAPPTTAPPVPTTAPPPALPAIADDTIVIRDDKDTNIMVLDNDAPVAGVLLARTLTIITPPQHAKDYRVHDDHLHYRSVKGYVGLDSMTYRVCDTSGACATATVWITVVP